jgi:signal peptidase I
VTTATKAEETGKIARDYGTAILVAVAVALFLRFLVIEAYRIPTPAMHPTLEPGDTIFVAKAPLGFDRKPKRGDVVVFAGPTDPDRDYIKRVIALAGDTVEVKKGQAIIDGKPSLIVADAGLPPCGREAIYGDPSRSYPVCWEPPALEDFGPEKVPEGSVFVAGDLRSQGPADSKRRRTWGMIPLASIKGKALWIWLSVEPAGTGLSSSRFPSFRFDRMFRRIE